MLLMAYDVEKLERMFKDFTKNKKTLYNTHTRYMEGKLSHASTAIQRFTKVVKLLVMSVP